MSKILEDKKRKAGRKTISDEKADQRVTIYLTKKQLNEIENYCFNNRLKVGTYIKDTFFNDFDKKKGKQKKEILDIEKYLGEQSEEKIGRLVLEFLKPKTNKGK